MYSCNYLFLNFLIYRWSVVRDFYKAIHRDNNKRCRCEERNDTEKQNQEQQSSPLMHFDYGDEFDETCFHFEDSIIEEEQKNNEYSELEASRFKALGIIEISDDDDENHEKRNDASEESVNSTVPDERILDNVCGNGDDVIDQHSMEHTITRNLPQRDGNCILKQGDSAKEKHFQSDQKRSHSDTLLSPFLHDEFVLMPSRKRSYIEEANEPASQKEIEIIEIDDPEHEQISTTETAQVVAEKDSANTPNVETDSLDISYTRDDLETRIAKRLAAKQHKESK